MSCANIYCKNDAESSQGSSIVNCEGDLVCSASCKRVYEVQRAMLKKAGAIAEVRRVMINGKKRGKKHIESVVGCDIQQSIKDSRDIFIAHAMTVLKKFPHDQDAVMALKSYDRYKAKKNAST